MKLLLPKLNETWGWSNHLYGSKSNCIGYNDDYINFITECANYGLYKKNFYNWIANGFKKI